MDASFQKELIALADLVDNGELPETAIPRLFYFGHKLVCTYYTRDRKFRCIKCKHDFTVVDKEGKGVVDATCPICKTFDNVYDVTGDDRWNVKWRCKSCSHEWIGEDGYVCPDCGNEVKGKK